MAYLQRYFPTTPLPTLLHIFPLLVPLDLDVAVSWSLVDDPKRQGVSFLHGVRLAPEFSIVEGIRRQVDEAIALGGKSTRTMYEETGRLRQVLMDSVLEGVLSQEDDPIEAVITTATGLKVTAAGEAGSVVSVRFIMRNRSPALPVRWILDLPENAA
jgi:hypothetical protein